MGFSMRIHRCLILQVVTLSVYFQGKASGAITRGCAGSQLSLECPEMKVISVTAVVLGDSYCSGTLCCIKDNDCTHNANEQHRNEVHSRCDGKRRCNVNVIVEKIPCGYWNARSINDFEQITYNCRHEPRNGTTSDNGDIEPDDNEDGEQTEKGGQSKNSSIGAIVAVCVVCSIVLIAIIVSLSIIVIRRRKRLKSSVVVRTSNIGNDGEESNDNSKEVEKSLDSGPRNCETPAIDYCELETTATGRSQAPCDSAYEHLDNGRNYEPLNFYEQLQ